ncbi:MAG: peptide-methionine (S)-S-oxide reductase [Dehalococcoidales bacterium]|nr:MAG: peptide-methionine (S)-S-oxide reductase [Dehalococcoidales bacterium]
MDGVIRTRVGYAGGTEPNPTYRNIGTHSETIQIDFDPEIVSYEELLGVFWAANAAYLSPFSRQYNSIIFYHDEEQKMMAEESYRKRLEGRSNLVLTEIIHYKEFTLAELYHQKYYLQVEERLLQDALSNHDDFEGFIFSTTAARLNGYAGGYGDPVNLEKELESYGLSDRGEKILLEIAERGLRQACPVHVN